MNKNLRGLLTSQFALLLLACALCTQAKAQTNKSFNDTKEACAAVFGRERAGERFGHIVNCGADILSMHPLAPAAKSIVPGGGIGFGVTSKVDILKQALPNFDTTLTTNARLSLTRFWTAESYAQFSRKPTDGSNYGWNVKPYVSRLELPHMDFYGLGGETTLNNLVSFNERETVGGFTGEYPIKFGTANPITQATDFHSALSLGGTVEFRSPRIGSVAVDHRRSIEQLFTEQTSPGILRGPDNFSHIAGSIGYRYPLLDPKGAYQLSAEVFHDFDHLGRYSFRRFEARIRQNVFRTEWFGALDLGARMSTSIATLGRRVPFYYQETLGGSNIRGEDTLRGYQDYRFRAPNVLLFQTDYAYAIPHTPLSALLFYDAGSAELRRRDLGRLRQSAGFGLALRTGNKILARLYVAFGSGRGTHTFADFNSLAMQ